MARKRKHYQPGFKAQVALAALKEDRTVNELVRLVRVTRLRGVFTTKVLENEKSNELEQESTVTYRMVNKNPWK